MNILLLSLQVLTVIYLIFRWRTASNRGLDFFGNPSLYLFALSTLYLIFPSYLYVEDLFKLIDFDARIVDATCKWSIYYFVVFYIFYIVSVDREITTNSKSVSGSRLVFVYIKVMLPVCGVFLALLVLYGTRDVNFSGIRPEKYIAYLDVKKIVGFGFLSWFVIIWSFYMAVLKRSFLYLLYNIPLVYLDVICSGRYYLFIFLIELLLYLIIVLRSGIKLRYVLSAIAIFFLIGVFRESYAVDESIFAIYITAGGEFINTWHSIGVVIGEEFLYSGSLFIAFVQGLIPDPFSTIMFGPKVAYSENFQQMHEFDFALGSSVVTEGVAYGVATAIIFPIAIGFIYLFVANFLNIESIEGRIIQLLFILNSYSVFRGSVVSNAASMIMIYFFIYFIPVLILKEMNVSGNPLNKGN